MELEDIAGIAMSENIPKLGFLFPRTSRQINDSASAATAWGGFSIF